jgi:hydrogenase maturation factor
MQPGKLPADLLSELLARLPTDPRVLLGPGAGQDAAAIDLGDGRVLVAKADPVTFASEEIGRYAVHVNANDVACLGATPLWFLGTVFLPPDSPRELAEAIFDQIRVTCAAIGVMPVGGHTEITIGLPRPLIAGTMLGETSLDRLIRPEDARPNDHLVLTGGIAIEGTVVLAREAAEELRAHGVPEHTIAAAARLLDTPGISVVRAATIATATGGVHALHDPTEGGIATALWELGRASGLIPRVRWEDISVLPETQAVCGALNIDPLGLLASGALLAAVDANRCDSIIEALAGEDIEAACVGELAAVEGDAIIGTRSQPRFERDELARFMQGLSTRPAGE